MGRGPLCRYGPARSRKSELHSRCQAVAPRFVQARRQSWLVLSRFARKARRDCRQKRNRKYLCAAPEAAVYRMKTRCLGKTGLQVPILGFGASSLGQEFRPVALNEALESVRVA